MLWCLISEPNGTIHELLLDQQAKGLDCLEKVGASYFNLGPVLTLAKWLPTQNICTKCLLNRNQVSIAMH